MNQTHVMRGSTAPIRLHLFLEPETTTLVPVGIILFAYCICALSCFFNGVIHNILKKNTASAAQEA